MLSDKALVFNVADLTVLANTALNQDGAVFELGRGSLSRNTQFVAIVQTADAERELDLSLLVSLDNGITYNYTAAKIRVPAGFRGQYAVPVAIPEFVWEKYPSGNIQCKVNAASATNAATGDWDTVRCYLGEGEPTIAGRKPNAAEAIQT